MTGFLVEQSDGGWSVKINGGSDSMCSLAFMGGLLQLLIALIAAY
jgi:hypothetical protein